MTFTAILQPGDIIYLPNNGETYLFVGKVIMQSVVDEPWQNLIILDMKSCSVEHFTDDSFDFEPCLTQVFRDGIKVFEGIPYNFTFSLDRR